MVESRQDAPPWQEPAYTAGYAAFLLGLPPSTVRSWTHGRHYAVASGTAEFERLVEPADPESGLLSFQNLVELHVLGGLRRVRKVQMDVVRSAIVYLRNQGHQHPLVEGRMLTDGVSLFVEQYNKLVDAGSRGQVALREALASQLDRVEISEEDRLARRLFPFSRPEDSPKLVAIDPTVRFGKPFLVSCGVATAVIHSRWRAGESSSALADDFGTDEDSIAEALRYEDAIRDARIAA